MFSELVPPTSTSASVPANLSGTISERSSRTASVACGRGGVALDRDGEERDLAVGGTHELALAEAWIGREGRSAARASAAATPVARGVRDDDLGRIGRRAREVALERDEALLGDEAVGQRGDAARSDVHPEHGEGEREEQTPPRAPG